MSARRGTNQTNTANPAGRPSLWGGTPRAIHLVTILLAALLTLALAFTPRAEAPPPDPGSIDTIGRANLDGSGVDQRFITADGHPTGVAVDGAHVYWISSGFDPLVSGGWIGRANLDGTGADPNFIFGWGSGVAVDNAHLYWPQNGISRANLDGTGVDDSFITEAEGIGSGFGPCGVAVDDQHVYWGTGEGIGRANLDGAGVDNGFITLPPRAPDITRCGVAVDASHVYWTNMATFTPNGRLVPGTIGRARLDGTGVDDSFITDAVNPCAVAVDAAHIYWAKHSLRAAGPPGGIGRADLDGTDADPSFIPLGLRAFGCGVVVDDSHLYWASRVSLPDNEFGFGKAGGACRQVRKCVKRNKKRGTAKLTIRVFDGPGVLVLERTKGVKRAEERVKSRPFETHLEKLRIRARGKAKRRLNARGKARVEATVTYTPKGGEPNTQTLAEKVKLVKRP